MIILHMREMKHKELNNLPKVTQPARDRSRIQMQISWLQNLESYPLYIIALPQGASSQGSPGSQAWPPVFSWQRVSWVLGLSSLGDTLCASMIWEYICTWLSSQTDSCLCYQRAPAFSADLHLGAWGPVMIWTWEGSDLSSRSGIPDYLVVV